jgi:hypothetical protein
MALYDRASRTLIVNLELDAAAEVGEVRLDITPTVDDGIGDHLVERQLRIRSPNAPAGEHLAGPLSSHRHGGKCGGEYPGASVAVITHNCSLPTNASKLRWSPPGVVLAELLWRSRHL